MYVFSKISVQHYTDSSQASLSSLNPGDRCYYKAQLAVGLGLRVIVIVTHTTLLCVPSCRCTWGPLLSQAKGQVAVLTCIVENRVRWFFMTMRVTPVRQLTESKWVRFWRSSTWMYFVWRLSRQEKIRMLSQPKRLLSVRLKRIYIHQTNRHILYSSVCPCQYPLWAPVLLTFGLLEHKIHQRTIDFQQTGVWLGLFFF